MEKMTDRDMLMLTYGAIKAVEVDVGNLDEVVELLERHLFPKPLTPPREEK